MCICIAVKLPECLPMKLLNFHEKRINSEKKKKEKDGFVRITVIVWRATPSEVIMRGEI